MIHIYHGNGKGKTTAAVGLAVRAVGAGMRVFFFQFLKNGTSSEINVLRKCSIETFCCEACTKFTFMMNDEEKKAVAEEHNSMLYTIIEMIKNKSADMIVMDEFLDAWNKEMLDIILAEKIITECSADTELIITGRSPAEKITEKADYISEIKEIKHPYTRGVAARKGIEY